MERLRPDRASGMIRKKEDRLAVLEADEARLPALTAQLGECRSKEEELTRELSRIRSMKQQYALSVPQLPEETDSRSRLASVRKNLASARENLAAAEDRLSSLKAARRGIMARGQRERDKYLQVKKELDQELETCARIQRNRCFMLRAGAAAGVLAAVLLLALCFSGVLPKTLLFLPVLFLAAAGWALHCSSRLAAGSAGSSDAGFGFPFPESEGLLRLREEKDLYSNSLRALTGKLHRTDDRIREQQLLREKLRNRIRKLEATASADINSAPADTNSASADMNQAEGRVIPSEIARTLSDFDVREEECRSGLQDIRQQSEELDQMIRECRSSQDSIPALRSEISALREQYDTCVKTLSYLEEARNLFTSRYMNPFLRSFRRYYGMLTGESAESVQTDADLGIMILDRGLPRDPSLLSEGTRDMISLCRRMAMIDAMYPGEKPFLVLDDPFSNLDDERLKGGMRFLHTASLEYQILYLTCHGSRL